jgi:uncharacterized integral membrane protein
VFRRILWLIVAFPAAVLLTTFAVINRYKAVVVLNPFATPKDVAEGLAQLNPAAEAAQQAAVAAAGSGFGIAPGVGMFLPLSMICFLFLILGLLAGGAASWLAQGKWRRQARRRTIDAHRWRAEAERLTRERDAATAASKTGKALPSPSQPRLASPAAELA